MAYRDTLKETIHEIIINHQQDPLDVIKAVLAQQKLPVEDYENVKALIIEELRRLHEGVLARYGLRPSQYQQWLNRKSN